MVFHLSLPVVPVVIVLTVTITGISAQQIQSELTLNNGHGSRVYTVACDELHCHPASGTDHPLNIRELENATATAKYAARRDGMADARLELVLYERGKPRLERFRRSLSRQIVVAMDATVPAAEIAAAVQAASFEVPAFSPRHLILSFKNPGDSLIKLAGVRKVQGVAMAKPLLASRAMKRFTSNDPRYAWNTSNTGYQWHLNNTGQNGSIAGHDVNVTSVWNSYLGSGVTIGIVDDGLEVTHPDLSPNANTTIDHNWNNGAPDDPTPTSIFDGHGTSCAGVAAARGGNAIGVTGVAPQASLVGLRLIAGSITAKEEAEALAWRNDIIDIKSNSWGWHDSGDALYSLDPLVADALIDGTQNGRDGLGVIYVWAGGNGRQNGDYSNYDGHNNAPETISVGAVDSSKQQSYYSESGANVLVCAPSNGGTSSITTTTLVAHGSYTDEFGGTSSATPLVAGVVALILEANPDLGWRDIQEILIRSSNKINLKTDPNWSINGAGFAFHHGYGAGMVDAEAAVALAKNWQNLGPQQSVTRTSGSLGLPIPDDNSVGISASLIFPPGKLRVEHVRLTVDINHSYRGDLVITLTSPDGTMSRFSEVHGDGYSDINYTFLSVHHWGESATGTWTVNISDELGIDTGQLNTFSLELLGSTPPSGYDRWALGEFSPTQLADSNISGESADPDDDGRLNLLEYATEGNPHSSDRTREPVLVGTNGTLRLQYIADTAKTDLTYQIKVSFDLVTWINSAGTVIATDNSLEIREIKLTAGASCYARLEVTRESL
ncbi:MAG: S8 family peptidase [Verrucomicrobiales bacterium]